MLLLLTERLLGKIAIVYSKNEKREFVTFKAVVDCLPRSYAETVRELPKNNEM